MRTMRERLITYSATALAVLLLTPALWATHQTEEAASVLQRIEANAIDIRNHAARLQTFARQPQMVSWETHAFEISRIRHATNDMAELLGDFKDLKPYATKRQNKAFNVLVSKAEILSDNAEKAIKIVNQEKEKLVVPHPEYEKAVSALYDDADNIVAAVGLAESWDEVREAREKLFSKN